MFVSREIFVESSREWTENPNDRDIHDSINSKVSENQANMQQKLLAQRTAMLEKQRINTNIHLVRGLLGNDLIHHFILDLFF